MKNLLPIVVTCLVIFSCTKKNTDNFSIVKPGLAGGWRMISVTDALANTASVKPSSISGDVDINFQYSTSIAGMVDGVTPTNSLQGDYTTPANGSLSIPAISMTKVMETSWGLLFLNNITFTRSYSFSTDGKLNITTATNKILTFIRR